MRKAVLAALALSAATITQAKADYVWQFVPTRVTAMSFDGLDYYPTPGVSHAEAKTWFPTFRIQITNEAFRSRSLDLNWGGCEPGGCQSGPTGDFSKLVAFEGFWGTDPNSLWGYGDIELSWTKGGKLSGSIDLKGDVTDVAWSIGPGRSGTEGIYAADDSECGMGYAQRCDMTGHWAFLGDPPGAPVPEPASFALLAVGLLGAGVARKLG